MKELKSEHYILFRDGMELRKKHIEEFFGFSILHRVYPELIIKTDSYSYKGTDKLKQLIPEDFYNPFDFHVGSPDIVKIYENDEPLTATKLNDLPPSPNLKYPSQVYSAMISGILKYGTRGYYFDNTGLEEYELYKIMKLQKGEL